MFPNPNIVFPILVLIHLIYQIWENSRNKFKKHSVYQKLFWPFTAWINCSSDLKIFENSRPLALNFKSFPRLLEQFFLTVGLNNFGDKITFLSLWLVFFSKKNLYLTPVIYKVIIEKSRFGRFLWNRNWDLGRIWAKWLTFFSS